MPFANMIIGINPFIFAFVGALVLLKVPIAIPFIIVSVMSYVSLGITGVTQIIVFTLLFAVIQSFGKRKGGFKKDFKNFILAMIFTSILLILVKVYSFSNIALILLQLLLSAIFLVLYRSGLKTLFDISKKTILNRVELFAFVCVIISAISPFKSLVFMDISLFSLLCVVLIMILSCKREVLHAAVTSIIVMALMTMFEIIVPLKVILVVITAIIVALLSRAGKKGMIIGFIFSVAFSIIMMFKIGEETGIHSIASRVIVQMAIGFAILLLIPEGLYNCFTGEDDLSEKIKSRLEKMFPKRAKFLLSPGKPNEENDLKKVDKNKDLC